MTGPWTATGQPETNKSRTWWIVGGIIVAVLAVFVAFLAGRGWDAATGQASDDDPASTFRLPLSPGSATVIVDRWPGPDPITTDDAESWARDLCTQRLDGVQVESLYEQIPLSSQKLMLTAIAEPQYAEFFVATTLHEACPDMVPR